MNNYSNLKKIVEKFQNFDLFDCVYHWDCCLMLYSMRHFDLKDVGRLHYFFGIEVKYFPNGITSAL